MYYRNVYTMAAAVLRLALAFGVGVAVGQNAPSESTGMRTSPPAALDQGGEIDGVEGRQLKLRMVTLESGCVSGFHSHNGRPGVAYVLQGTLSEHAEGGGVHVRSQGESWTEGKAIMHWVENKGGNPVVIVAVDVFKP